MHIPETSIGIEDEKDRKIRQLKSQISEQNSLIDQHYKKSVELGEKLKASNSLVVKYYRTLLEIGEKLNMAIEAISEGDLLDEISKDKIKHTVDIKEYK